MKKIVALFVLVFSTSFTSIFSQTDYNTAIPGTNADYTEVRGPQGMYRYQKSIWLITANEMASAGFVNGDVFNTLAFNYLKGLDIATTGTLKVYLQNSTDTGYTKGTTWTTAISGMTLVRNEDTTLPTASGQFNIPFTTNFTYNGGGVYVAFEYQNASGTLATLPSRMPSNISLKAGLCGYFSATTNSTTLSSTANRPLTIFNKTVACTKPTNIAIASSALTSVDLTFTSSTPVNLEYGPYGFIPGTGTTVEGITSPYKITDLQASTAYDVYLRSDCGGSGLSSLSDVLSFTTVFEPVTPTYTTDFEALKLGNIGWLAEYASNNTTWKFITSNDGAPVNGGEYAVASIGNTTAQADAMLYSRGVSLQGGTPVTVSFYADNFVANGSSTKANYVLSAGTAQTVAAQTIIVGSESAFTSSAFVLKTYSFTPVTSGVYYFGLLNRSPVVGVGYQALIIDDFSVSQTLSNDVFLDSKFAVYPNPAKNTINVSNTTEALISNVEIIDLNGRVVKNIKLSGVTETQISISDLAQGVYTMKIISDKGALSKKIIKE